MRARFQIRCLGEPALLTIGGRTVRVRTRKELALLCYLAVEQRWHSRDALAELLWPDRPHRESRHSLAAALSALRGKLGREILETESQRVRVRPEGVAVDVDRLLAGDIVGSDTEVPLDVDGFLEGFEIQGAVGFSHWRDGERARLLPHVLDALVVLIDRCRRRGDFRQIETLALRLQRFEPLSEQAMRARMEARAFSGDRLTALRLFEHWKHELAEQLQAVPSDLVEGMALRLRRRGWERPGSADIPTVHTDQWKDRPFVGRATEYRELYEAWETVQRCEPAHRLILGDSGIGKSTLVERVTTAAGLEGATVARVQCHEAEREIPYAMVSGLIAQLVDRPGASAAPPESLAELAQLVSEVRRRFPSLPTPLETHGDAFRIRFTEATHALIGALAEEHPVVLVVDDVHHSDDVSLAVLHRVIRLADRQALLVFFLARPGELHQSPQASRLREQGQSLGVRPLGIGPLSREESIDLLESILKDTQSPASPTVQRTLVAAAAGFPLVLELLVKDWAESGEHSLLMALDAVTADPGDLREPHDAYRMLVDRLVTHLDPTTRTVLEVAAVLGPHLTETALYAVADLKMGEVMSGMSRLADLRLLREVGGHLEFANDLVRGHVYLRVPHPVRHRLHALFADALLARARSGDESLDLAIAWHAMRSGRTEEATAHLLAGSRSAIRRGAVHEAERRLSSALGRLHGAARTEATLLLAELLQEQGRLAESEAALRADPEAASCIHGGALQRYAELLTAAAPATHTASMWAWVKSAFHAHLPRDAARAMLRLVAEIAYATSDTDLVLAALAHLESLSMQDWTGDDAIELGLQKAYIEFFSQRCSWNARATREKTLARLLYLLDLSGNALSVNRRAVRLLSGIGLMHKGMGRYAEAMPFFGRALDVSNRLQNQTRIATSYMHLAACSMESGDITAQLRWAERCLALPFVSGTTPLGIYLASTAYALTGSAGRAVELSDRLSSIAETLPTTGRMLCLLHAADGYWLTGRHGQAYRIALQGASMEWDDPIAPVVVGPLCRWLAILLRDRPSAELRTACSIALQRHWEASDLWDTAEAAAGNALSAELLGAEPSRFRARLEAVLSQLPTSAKQHLRRYSLC